MYCWVADGLAGGWVGLCGAELGGFPWLGWVGRGNQRSVWLGSDVWLGGGRVCWWVGQLAMTGLGGAGLRFVNFCTGRQSPLWLKTSCASQKTHRLNL